MKQQSYRGGAGNFANDPERAKEAGRAEAKPVEVISETILKEPLKRDGKEARLAVVLQRSLSKAP
jgi:hypothetical protein